MPTHPVGPIDPVRQLERQLLSPRPDSLGQLLQHHDRRIPVDTRVRDTHTFLETCRPLRRDFLVSLVQMRFDHHTDDGGFTSAKLVSNNLGYFGLVAVVFERVS